MNANTIKLTAVQAKALIHAYPHTDYATATRDGSYTLEGDIRKSTRNALVRMGLLVPSGHFLTVRGRRATLAIQEAMDTQNVYTQGCKIDLAPASDDAELFCDAPRVAPVCCRCSEGSDADGFVCGECERAERGESATIMSNADVAEYDRAQMINDAPGILGGVLMSAVLDAVKGDDAPMIVSDSAAATSALIMGSEPNTWAPEFDRPSARECFYGCGSPVVAVFLDMYGVTQGLCASDMGRVDGKTYPLPNDAHTGTEDVSEGMALPLPDVDTVCVVQAWMGSNGMNHYHAPGCRDIKREAKRHNASEGLGMYSYPFTSVAAIIEHEYFDVENGDPRDMIAHANSDFDGLRIMPCLSIPMGEIQGMPVEFKGGIWALNSSAISTPEMAEESIPEFTGTHSLRFYVETEGKGYVYECQNCGSMGTPNELAAFPCELSTVTDERMTMVHRGAHMPSCDSRQEITGAPVSMVAAELTCPKCISELDPTIVTAPKVHAFPSTGEAYNASQCMEEIKDGDILTVPSESAVAILVKAWPVAVTEAHGEFHGTGKGMAECVAALDAARVEDGSDYSASLAMAESVIRAMAEVTPEHNFNKCDAPECEECATALYNACSDKECDACAAYERFGYLVMYRGVEAMEADAPSLVTREYHLSVTVDEITGASVDLGWVTLTVPAMYAESWEHVAAVYGAVHGEGTPRNGWGSIIKVHAMWVD